MVGHTKSLDDHVILWLTRHLYDIIGAISECATHDDIKKSTLII